MNREWKAKYNHPQSWTFEIGARVMFDSGAQKDVSVFFLRVFDGEREQLFDYFQKEMEAARNQALRKWGVPVDSWVEQGDMA